MINTDFVIIVSFITAHIELLLGTFDIRNINYKSNLAQVTLDFICIPTKDRTCIFSELKKACYVLVYYLLGHIYCFFYSTAVSRGVLQKLVKILQTYIKSMKHTELKPVEEL